MGKVFIGTSGYQYRHWKEKFYAGIPQRQWLSYYASHFSTVEINATFYGFFQPSTYQKWNEATPDMFHFVLKGPRRITHQKKLNNIAVDLAAFYQNAQILGSKLKLMLWQFPLSYKQSPSSIDRLTSFLRIVPSAVEHVFEFRDESWFTNMTYELLERHNAGIVVNDAKLFPKAIIATGPIAYIRFHGPDALYASSYTDTHLAAWARRIHQFQTERDVYCFFNNDIGGHAIDNAQTLQTILRE
jgi:uncharacterized protein YecE (DUF72 family)